MAPAPVPIATYAISRPPANAAATDAGRAEPCTSAARASVRGAAHGPMPLAAPASDDERVCGGRSRRRGAQRFAQRVGHGETCSPCPATYSIFVAVQFVPHTVPLAPPASGIFASVEPTCTPGHTIVYDAGLPPVACVVVSEYVAAPLCAAGILRRVVQVCDAVRGQQRGLHRRAARRRIHLVVGVVQLERRGDRAQVRLARGALRLRAGVDEVRDQDAGEDRDDRDDDHQLDQREAALVLARCGLLHERPPSGCNPLRCPPRRAAMRRAIAA